ncbi:sensor domain-containing protein [Nocardioides sp. HM23]|uniref:sensor histidine kinase n=1 Tax=Nocardioides bizhenqiangii TaxID=3095076 RepID=UPI002ACACE9B|nr:sensor domain-containing protein [Nocardioides sp. HM23]MDZ5621917.1 sensor domain-containing protein [Nocardioides sp. HM23]
MTDTMLMPVVPTSDRTIARRVLLDSAYAFTAFVLAIPAFVLVVAGVAAGLGTMVVAGLGLAVLLGTAYVARGFAHVERLRLRSMVGVPAPLPSYQRAQPGDSKVRAVLTPLRDAQSWLDILWCLIGFVTGAFAFAVTLAWWATTLGGLSYWFWEQFVPRGPDNRSLADMIGLGESRSADVTLQTAVGLVALVTLPFAVRMAAATHAAVSRVLLCSRVELMDRMVRMEESRDSAHRAEAHSLRRLERDIHDGPQQRLIRLGMDLGRARRQLSDDPELAADTIDAALAQTRETVDELRALSRGIAPPLLVDRGLEVAVREMAAGQAIAVDVAVDVPTLTEPVETAAYFTVAEALTNIAKHSEATRAQVALRAEDGMLVVTVDDDGRGGARVAPGRGLDGLRERLAGVDGDLVVASPDGGPTRLRAEVPLR